MKGTDDSTQSSPQSLTLGRGAKLKAAVTEAYVVLDLLLATEIKALGLSVGEADVLTILYLNPEPVMPGQIADQLNITGAGTTGRLNNLEQRGYLQRVPNPDDGRSVHVHLTGRGRKQAEVVIRTKNTAIVNSLVERLGDEAIDDVVDGLNRVIATGSDILNSVNSSDSSL